MSDSVSAANVAMRQIATINARAAKPEADRSGCGDADGSARRRDQQAVQLMDIRVDYGSGNNQSSVYTKSGVTLVSGVYRVATEFHREGPR